MNFLLKLGRNIHIGRYFLYIFILIECIEKFGNLQSLIKVRNIDRCTRNRIDFCKFQRNIFLFKKLRYFSKIRAVCENLHHTIFFKKIFYRCFENHFFEF